MHRLLSSPLRRHLAPARPESAAGSWLRRSITTAGQQHSGLASSRFLAPLRPVGRMTPSGTRAAMSTSAAAETSTVSSATATATTTGSNKALFFAGGFIFLVVGMFGGVIYLSRQRSEDEAVVRALPLIEGNPVVYFDIGSNGEKVGRIVIHVRADVCPKAAANFVALATGSSGFGYRSSPLYGGEKGSRLFGGDFYGNGIGGYSIYGPTFEDEDLESLKHIGPGVVAMRNTGPDSNNSQFYITMRRLPEFDGNSQVVGFMTEGFELLTELNKYLDTSSYGNSRFQKGYDFRILRSGLMPSDYTKPTAEGAAEAELKAAVKEAMAADAASTAVAAATPAPDVLKQ